MSDYPVRTPAQLPGLLQAFRKAAGLTQAEAALRLGVTQQTLSALERNANRMSADRLMKLLAVLGVELVLRQGGAAATPTTPTPSAAPRAGEPSPPHW